MNTRKIMRLAALAVVVVALAAPGAHATPSTQIWIPSTDTQPMGTVHVGVDNYTTVFKKTEDGGHSAPTDFGFTVGVVDTAYIGAEVGLDLREQSDYPMYLNAKLQLKEDSITKYFPAIAFGVYDMGTESGKNDFNIAYLLAAKTLPVIGRITLGYYVGNEDMLKDASGGKENDGFMASFDRTLAEIDDRLWLAIDYMDGNNAYGALSFGLSWRFSNQVSAIVGYDIYNDKDVAGENTVTVQFDIDF